MRKLSVLVFSLFFVATASFAQAPVKEKKKTIKFNDNNAQGLA